MTDHYDIFKKAQTQLEGDYAKVQKRLWETKETPVGTFIERFLMWYNHKTLHQHAWATFHKVIDFDALNVLGSLDSFVGNCLLDDSYFTVEYRKPEYAETSFEGYPSGDLIWLPGGDFKTMLTTKDDPEGNPEVVRASDDGGTQNPLLLLEAMDIREEREAARIIWLEECQETIREITKKIRDGVEP